MDRSQYMRDYEAGFIDGRREGEKGWRNDLSEKVFYLCDGKNRLCAHGKLCGAHFEDKSDPNYCYHTLYWEHAKNGRLKDHPMRRPDRFSPMPLLCDMYQTIWVEKIPQTEE